ncbi:fungal-specific transcription factor domain-containing protein [Hypoxylon trugodes]|uniref:fungal-specific transcription factor domain-containing protein n=1 Tax=Hypoxylon trugodes TaxID=326681 RepID=UPI00218CC40F|nr:fungal-specific transcription factor domain-containing protein [Hypoxylon trugodes]KAI1394070.1 fungal-specific transcription factor domain-containing protein [Hypoxylon trugodes]
MRHPAVLCSFQPQLNPSESVCMRFETTTYAQAGDTHMSSGSGISRNWNNTKYREQMRMSSSQILPTDLSYGSSNGVVVGRVRSGSSAAATSTTTTTGSNSANSVVSALSPIAILTPTSASTLYASPDSAGGQTFFGGGGGSSAKSEPDDDDIYDGAGSGDSVGDHGHHHHLGHGAVGSVATASSFAEPAKKKQKRNKPTLSCHECVERKTKCDRGRPHCLACIKRQTECKYAHVANLLEETSRSATNGRRMTKPPKKKVTMSGMKPAIPNIADRGILTSRIASPASNVFGVGTEHPFANYWTCEGGLPEVIGVLPEKLQADILLSQYYECVDPVYPIVDRHTFYLEYEHFWALRDAEKTDAAFVGLIFIMMALGTQFVTTTNPKDRKQTSEFYASAGNQALRMSSYLSTATLSSVQAMVLIGYFLINDNHASDGWAFSGLLLRQAYAMGLHRDPNIVIPNASEFDKQQRRKLWQAVLVQDTFLTVLLSLPPNATHTDVKVDDFVGDPSGFGDSDPIDIAYIRGTWMLANLVQETISSPRSLDVPICSTQRQKSKLVADFRAVYRSFPDVFRSWDQESIAQLACSNKRVVRQTLFLSSNYYHNLMLVHASESPDVPVNVRATLEAAHEALSCFFVLFTLFDPEARVWWVFHHRAFLEALCIGSVLREAGRDPATADQFLRDPLFARAKADITRMIQIMKIIADGDQGSEDARTRVEVLSEFL